MYSYIYLLFIIYYLATVVDAWWDAGHLLIAAIAQLQLTPQEIKILNAVLSVWNSDYPEQGKIIPAAIWADHIKCHGPASYCQPTGSVDGLTVFNSWHYVMLPYNPNKLRLSSPYSSYPLPGFGSVWLLSSLLPFDIQTRINEEHLKWTYNSNYRKRRQRRSSSRASSSEPSPSFRISQRSRTPTVERLNRHDVDRSSFLDSTESFLSLTSLNLRLRFIIHIFGDIHQPLHTMETFSPLYPYGDSGGGRIPVDLVESNIITDDFTRKSIKTLHALWDSCGGLYTTPWPDYTEAETIKTASELIKQFPQNALHENVINTTTIQDVADDSYKLGVNVVYSGVDLTSKARIKVNGVIYGNEPYKPSDDYIKTVRYKSQRQIVLGGYRLSLILKDFANYVQKTHPYLQENCSQFDLNRVGSPAAARRRNFCLKSIIEPEKRKKSKTNRSIIHRIPMTNSRLNDVYNQFSKIFVAFIFSAVIFCLIVWKCISLNREIQDLRTKLIECSTTERNLVLGNFEKSKSNSSCESVPYKILPGYQL